LKQHHMRYLDVCGDSLKVYLYTTFGLVSFSLTCLYLKQMRTKLSLH